MEVLLFVFQQCFFKTFLTKVLEFQDCLVKGEQNTKSCHKLCSGKNFELKGHLGQLLTKVSGQFLVL